MIETLFYVYFSGLILFLVIRGGESSSCYREQLLKLLTGGFLSSKVEKRVFGRDCFLGRGGH